MRDYQAEFEKRVTFIQSVLNQSKANSIVYGNSGGKDSALSSVFERQYVLYSGFIE